MIPSPIFVQKFQKSYLHICAELVRQGKVDLKTVQSSAKDLLGMLPFLSYEDMKSKIAQLAHTYEILTEVYLQLMQSIEEERKQILIKRIGEHIHGLT